MSLGTLVLVLDLVTGPSADVDMSAPVLPKCVQYSSERKVMLFRLIPMQKQADAETLWECEKDWLDTHMPQEFLQQSKKPPNAYFLHTLHLIFTTLRAKFKNLANQCSAGNMQRKKNTPKQKPSPNKNCEMYRDTLLRKVKSDT